MPEGPETKRMADAIGKALIGKKIESHRLLHQNLQTLRIDDSTEIVDVLSLGKALICRLNNDQSIISHNQLYGKWTVNLKQTPVKTGRSLRIEFNTETRSVRLWSATDISVHETKKEKEHPYIKKLGPDVLVKATTIKIILARLKSPTFRNRMLSSLLLDQGFIAGLGNYLRSEILFFSKVMYYEKPRDLIDEKLSILAENIKRVSQRAYYQKGNTLDKTHLKSVYGNHHNFKRLRHMVFNRVSEPCIICGKNIERVRVGKRRIDFCICCQESNDLNK